MASAAKQPETDSDSYHYSDYKSDTDSDPDSDSDMDGFTPKAFMNNALARCNWKKTITLSQHIRAASDKVNWDSESCDWNKTNSEKSSVPNKLLTCYIINLLNANGSNKRVFLYDFDLDLSYSSIRRYRIVDDSSNPYLAEWLKPKLWTEDKFRKTTVVAGFVGIQRKKTGHFMIYVLYDTELFIIDPAGGIVPMLDFGDTGRVVSERNEMEVKRIWEYISEFWGGTKPYDPTKYIQYKDIGLQMYDNTIFKCMGKCYRWAAIAICHIVCYFTIGDGMELASKTSDKLLASVRQYLIEASGQDEFNAIAAIKSNTGFVSFLDRLKSK